MRLLLSVTAQRGDEPRDVVVECPPGARVRDVAQALDALVPTARARVVPRGSGHLGVVTATVAEAGAPDLWWHGAPLDADVPVEQSPLRHGAVVGLGVDPGDVWAEPDGACEVRVVSGRQAGRVHRLPVGRHVLGSDPAASVPVDDPDVPPVAVVLEVGVDGSVTVEPAPEVLGAVVPAPVRRRPPEGPIVVPRGEPAAGASRGRRPRGRFARQLAQARQGLEAMTEVDPESDRPLVHVDRIALTAAQPWHPGESLVVGDVVLEVGEVGLPDASLSPSAAGATLDYNRPPRLLPPVRPSEFRLPPEPRMPDKQRFPLTMVLMPLVMGAAMYWFTRSPYALIIMGLSPLMAIGNFVSSRGGQRSKHVEAVRTYVQRVARIEQQAFESLRTESASRRRDLPDPATVLLFATGPRARLWERRRTDPDWMLARVGTADLPSEVSLHDPGREEHERVQHWTAADVPVAVPLARVGVTGVVGPADARRRVGAWMLAQVVAAHSPADVSVHLLADPDGGQEWGWVRWLPHARRDGGPVAQVGTDEETTARRISELLAVLEQRRSVARGQGVGFGGSGAVLPAPVVVVLDGARRVRLLPGLVTLLREGPAHGIYFLCLDEQERQLPEECQAVVDLAGPTARVAVAGQEPVDGVRVDLVPTGWFERLGRSLAPIEDISTEDLSATLVASSRLLDVLGLDPPTPADVARGWAAGGRTTRAVIGESSDGPFAVDVRADGPHGLVAGTTGSGKSELLQTMIASLAIGNRPDEMTFVLVDYKGGAAFKDCSRLPHTVGMVTDLDAHLTTRALESLAAELRRREHQLADAGAKDIEDYLAARGPADAPMPRLMIVIDEFAALVAELPDFVTGLVDIARRGRSLGVHLVLATQRPAGVVSAEIKSNTNLRIALRVTDRNDSQDVIEAPDAAEIAPSLPGRAYARLGHTSLVAFQSSRVGGRPPSVGGGARVDVTPLTWAGTGRPVPVQRASSEDDVDVPTDLASLVTAVQGAATLAGVSAPPPPWLPALGEVVTAHDVATQGGEALAARPLALPYGLLDLPAEQRRDVATHDLDTAGNLAVVGAARSGRSTVLRALAAAVATRTSPRDVHLYGLDFGNNALLPLMGLPHTGAVVPRDQPDRVARLTRRLRAEISRRQQLLAEQSFADVREQRAGVAPAQRLPYLLVLLDRWEGFIQAFEDVDAGALVDLWTQILQEGPGAGVKVVVAGDRSLLAGRISTLTEDRVMLPMPDPGDYQSVGLSVRDVPQHLPEGRAFRSEGPHELQVCLLDDDPSGPAQVAALQAVGRTATARHAGDPVPATGAQVPFRIDPLPTRLTLDEAAALGGPPLRRTAVPLGVGGDTLALHGLEAEEHGPGLLVLGPRRSGRSTTLLTVGESALRRGWTVGVVTPRRSPLRDLAARDGVVAIEVEATRDEVTAALALLVPQDVPSVLLVDDLELVGTDGVLADAIVAHLGALRDRPGLVVAAGTADELGSAYRGPAATIKKSRSGLLLAPATPNDGDLFGLRLPRSAIGGAVPGRGLLVSGGAWQLVQVPLP
ncbi:cell division-like protein [Cellulomonas sp. zg-ZUI199]|uniref:Cell division-like protein n=1 Tax=Cellulomonas wangleii TaxID=2816956 RepID=A0ABX8D519_9CELL|nr:MULTISPECIES: FtsK/SpoIIIE domain-containing protein [Cellulomonas]MBO0898841.1 cell division-like protein [Cellulomonas sp. zg-ZUI22]MBO0923870.1 cell division-like protein [Cellulomonas wangleii]MBO0924152.1 cell division-like protein [Cellulomonas wangleii]QVI62176.1 cell division-like protein [Cellulomonas wangleii]